MAGREHLYRVALTWTGNRGGGTTTYRSYGRDHEVSAPGKITLPGSADPAFRGDADRWNPEELLVAALSQCHLLSYLHVCADAGVVVTAYTDQATGTMRQTLTGGRFSEVTLHPVVTVAAAQMAVMANALHETAHAACFIAASVNFTVTHEPTIEVA